MSQYQFFERYPMQQLEDSSSDEDEVPYNYANQGTTKITDVSQLKKCDLLLSSDDELNQSSSSSSSDSSDSSDDSSSSDESDNEPIKFFPSPTSEDDQKPVPSAKPSKRSF